MQEEEVSPSSLQGGGGDSHDISVDNGILPCSSNPVMQEEEVSPSSLQGGGGDSHDISVDNGILPCSSNPVMQEEEVSPSSLQVCSGDTYLKNSSSVCSSTMVSQDTKFAKEAKLSLVNYTDSDESAVSSNANEDVPSSTIQSKEKIPVGFDLSDSSMTHGDDVRQLIVPRLRRTKSVFVSPTNKYERQDS
ncbi:unnamed protein product [Gadus morhua 'NCC']